MLVLTILIWQSFKMMAANLSKNKSDISAEPNLSNFLAAQLKMFSVGIISK